MINALCVVPVFEEGTVMQKDRLISHYPQCCRVEGTAIELIISIK